MALEIIQCSAESLESFLRDRKQYEMHFIRIDDRATQQSMITPLWSPIDDIFRLAANQSEDNKVYWYLRDIITPRLPAFHVVYFFFKKRTIPRITTGEQAIILEDILWTLLEQERSTL